ncbi:hypothetical protein ACGFNU_38615 [Spirillospora sp. NPDC048911]|uniref:hypothetical protein n=1 Tax=Spirillospora sp. NPDC048911 TaxID=3364527 RepID=UPI003717F389
MRAQHQWDELQIAMVLEQLAQRHPDDPLSAMALQMAAVLRERARPAPAGGAGTEAARYAGDERDDVARERDVSAKERDERAALRDAAARARDVQALQAGEAAAADDRELHELLRQAERRDRGEAGGLPAADHEARGAERAAIRQFLLKARESRQHARQDRYDSKNDRQDAGQDRLDAQTDRHKAATDRQAAQADRDQVVIDGETDSLP